MLTQAGQSENMADQMYVDGNVTLSAESVQTEVSVPSSYVPAFGDVVEFDDINDERQKGIVFVDHDGDLVVAFDDNWHTVEICHNFVKRGSTDCIPNGTKTWNSSDIAKAYFSAPAAIKVGDRVKVVELMYSDTPVGSIYEVSKVDRDGDVWLKDNHCHSPKWIEPVK